MVLRHSGFTLLELLVVISISAILVALGSGYIDDTINRMSAKQKVSEIQLLLSKARATALFSNTKVTLCPLTSQQQCGNNWNEELSLFTDPNHNRILDSNETILQRFPPSKNKHTLRHFNNLAVGFNGQGFASYNAGSFSYCYKNKSTLGAIFIISRIGRVRFAMTTDANNLPTTPSGNPIPCPN